MFSRSIKNGVFVLEGLNSFSTVLYFYYFYFYMQKTFGFGNKANLILAALNGAMYALGCWGAGKLAQRVGYFNGLKIGFATMGAALGIAIWVHTPAAHIVLMLINVLGMCCTWPILEALVSEGEPPSEVPHMVGVYNVVWAGTGALAYFVGGALIDGLGMVALFAIPFAISLTQLGLVAWLQSRAVRTGPAPGTNSAQQFLEERPPMQTAKTFLRMAWLANPFAYIAINTVIAVMPGVAERLQLSTMQAGFVCSVWLFARLAAFLILWLWSGWHYRFNWLFTAFVGLAASFSAILMLPNLAALVVAQLIFGGAVGLVYYSSLYYSMDVSETKSEHGGIHEAVIGLGNLAGPAVGAASIHLLPQYVNSGPIAVSLLLLCGLGGLVAIWRNRMSVQS